jgi:hypothetical protein
MGQERELEQQVRELERKLNEARAKLERERAEDRERDRGGYGSWPRGGHSDDHSCDESQPRRVLRVLEAVVSPFVVPANGTAEQAFEVNGVKATDIAIAIEKGASEFGLGVVQVRVSAAKTVSVTFSNNTGSPVHPQPSQKIRFVVLSLAGRDD